VKGLPWFFNSVKIQDIQISGIFISGKSSVSVYQGGNSARSRGSFRKVFGLKIPQARVPDLFKLFIGPDPAVVFNAGDLRVFPHIFCIFIAYFPRKSCRSVPD
jgi:hypothetical protein